MLKFYFIRNNEAGEILQTFQDHLEEANIHISILLQLLATLSSSWMEQTL
jgi:hypothetical protein